MFRSLLWFYQKNECKDQSYILNVIFQQGGDTLVVNNYRHISLFRAR